MRINKFLAEIGLASRRHADEMIAAGRVQINGKIASLGANVEEGDEVLLDGQTIVVSEKKEEYCKYFCETYKLVLDIWTKKLHNIDRPIISMGMSESFEEAIECGATLVRIGRTLFKKD